MTDPALPAALIELIRHSVPTFPAAELLVFVAQRPSAVWTLDSLLAELPRDTFARPALASLLLLFTSRGLMHEAPPGAFSYRPASKEMEEAVALLVKAFNERPVTLIKTIYALADNPIQSFADSFRFKKE